MVRRVTREADEAPPALGSSLPADSQAPEIKLPPLDKLCWLPAPLSPLAIPEGAPDEPKLSQEAEDDAISLASSLPVLEDDPEATPTSPATKSEEANATSPANKPDEDEANPSPGTKEEEPGATPRHTPKLHPREVAKARPPQSKKIHRLQPRQPRQATIVEHIHTRTYVENVLIHEETRQRTYYQDVLVDCTSALPKNS